MAKIRLPNTSLAVGQVPSFRQPDYPSTGEMIGQALQGLGQTLGKYAQNEAARADKNMLASNSIEGIIEASVKDSFESVEYNADGTIDYQNTIEKYDNVIEFSEGLWQSSEQSALEQVDRLPFKTREAKEAAMAAVTGFYKKGTVEERRQKLIKGQDAIKLGYVEDLVEEAKYSPDIGIEDVLVEAAGLVESMYDKSEGHKYLGTNAKFLINEKSKSPTGALEIIVGSENEELDKMYQPFLLQSLNTISKTLGTSLSELSQSSTNQSSNPVNPEMLSSLKALVDEIPEDSPILGTVKSLITNADQRIEYQKGVAETTKKMISGEDTYISDPQEVDDYLDSTGAYDEALQGDNPELNLYALAKSFINNNQVLPDKIKKRIDNFITQGDLTEVFEQGIFTEFAEAYQKGNIKNLSSEAASVLQTFIQSDQSLPFVDRARQLPVTVELDQAELELTSNVYLGFESAGTIFESDVETLLTKFARNKTIQRKVPVLMNGETVYYDLDELNTNQITQITQRLNGYIKEQLLLEKQATGNLANVNSSLIRQRAVDQFYNNHTIVPYKGMRSGQTEVPILITVPLTYGGKSIKPEQAIEFMQNKLIDILKSETLRGDELLEHIDEKFPEMQVKKHPVYLDRFEILDKQGVSITPQGVSITEMFDSVFNETKYIDPTELDTDNPDSLLNQMYNISKEQVTGFTEWKAQPPSDTQLETFPFREELSSLVGIMQDVPNEESFFFLKEMGNKLVQLNKADPLLRNPEFVKMFKANFQTVLSEQKKERDPTGGRYGYVKDVDTMEDIRRYKEEIKNADPNFKFGILSDVGVFDVLSPGRGLGVKAIARLSNPGLRLVQIAYQQTEEEFANLITAMSPDQRKAMYGQLKDPVVNLQQLSIDNLTPVGVIQDSLEFKEEGKTTSEDLIRMGLMQKYKRHNEVKDMDSSRVPLDSLPNNFWSYRFASSTTYRQTLHRLGLSDTTITEVQLAEIEDILDSPNATVDVSRIALAQFMPEVNPTKEGALAPSSYGILNAMTNKQFDKFIKRFIKEQKSKLKENSDATE